jgi:CHASE3 domain sensor protein
VRAPVVRHRDTVSTRYQELMALAADDPVQQERLKTFKSKLTQWFKLYNPMITNRRLQDMSGASLRPLNSQNAADIMACRELYDEMQDILQEMRADQERKSWLH